MQNALGKRKAGVTDENGIVVASSDVALIGERLDGIIIEYDDREQFTWNHLTFRRMGSRGKTEFFVFCDGDDEVANGFCNIIAISLAQLKQFYDEKYDKIGFIKNVLIDNIMVGDIRLKAKTLHIALDAPRICYVIRVHSEDYLAHEIIKNLFPDKSKDFVVSINETDVALVKDISEDHDGIDIDKIAHNIIYTLSSETLTNARIGIGTVVRNISEIGGSYKNACVALEVGKVFDSERPIVSYENLGIGRLIYQLPTKLCEMFLAEIFKKNTLDVLDDETIITIQKFLKYNLNVSEASRQLFVHRNTLIYRLDKIYKLTGLDLRNFDDAIVFKVAMMVNKYLNSDTVSM